MKGKIAIVEDQFIEANDLRLKLHKAGYDVCGIAASYAEAMRLIEIEKPDMVLVDIFLKGELTGIDLGLKLSELNVGFIYISANSNEEILLAAKESRPYGFIVKPYREKDLLVTLAIAQYHHNNSIEERLKRELYIEREFNAAAFLKTGSHEKLLHIAKALQRYLPFDLMVIKGSGSENLSLETWGFLRTGYNEYQIINDGHHFFLAEKKEELQRKGICLYHTADFHELAAKQHDAKFARDHFKMLSHLAVSLRLQCDKNADLFFYSKGLDTYTPMHIQFVEQCMEGLSSALENIKIPISENKQNEQPGPTVAGVSTDFSTIIGNSHVLLNVLDHVSQVAPVDTSVLILGESGTGKENIASSIHNLSSRKNQPFIKINCAALPSSLIESELFGYEKGSFTGALEKRIGKFEQANKGTVFLDEIGELPIELQPKLLRILQEREIERVGGKSPIKIDVRIIAATNRDLEKEVAAGKFRLDLYYRLNIFPILMPPLRERDEDIPLLMYHFLEKFNAKLGKKVNEISLNVINQAMEYTWPGNIRELENNMERAVLLSKGNVLDQLLPGSTDRAEEKNRYKTIEDNERDHIIRALKKCNGKVWGTGGAAELLNIPPSTLSSKIKKLGITINR